MKLIKTANGQKKIKISKKEWESIGENNGWTKEAAINMEWLQKIKNAFSMGKNVVSSILNKPNEWLIRLMMKIQDSAEMKATESALQFKSQLAQEINRLYREGKLVGVNMPSQTMASRNKTIKKADGAAIALPGNIPMDMAVDTENVKQVEQKKLTINELIELNPSLKEIKVNDQEAFMALITEGLLEGTFSAMQEGDVPLSTQLKYGIQIALKRGIRAFIFGFIDNAVMIAVGDQIDSNLKQLIHVSTLGAAGIGNLISDVFGEGVGGKIEDMLVASGVPPQVAQCPLVQKMAKHASIGCLALGCWAGMIIIPIKNLIVQAESDSIRLTKTASGKYKMSKTQWESIGETTGWIM